LTSARTEVDWGLDSTLGARSPAHRRGVGRGSGWANGVSRSWKAGVHVGQRGPPSAGHLFGRARPWVTAIIGSMYWPMTGLRLGIRLAARTRESQLELRLPDASDLMALAALAEAGVHDPAVQPFGNAWTDVEPAARARSVLQHHWRCLGSWEPADWTLNLVAVHGQGIGTAMRAAVLALAFDGLGAEFALSSAYTDNEASLTVSRRLGYADDGMTRHAIRGRPAEERRLRLSRESWRAAREALRTSLGEVTIDGLDPCLPLFGLG
jgi:hypothetical protein